MPDENLVKYIRNESAQGRSENVIRSLLVANGWAEKDVNDAFSFIKNGSAAPASPPVRPASHYSSPLSSGYFRRQDNNPPETPHEIDFVSSGGGNRAEMKPQGNTPLKGSGQEGKNNLRLYSAKGRLSRLPYFLFTVISIVILGWGPWIINLLVSNPLDSFLAGGIFWMFDVAVILPSMICYTAKRFHDLNKSGWYTVALLVPVWNFYLEAELLLQCGTEGSNQYGNDPLASSKNHNDLANRFGSSVAFKIVVAILLSAIYVAIGTYGYWNARLASQRAEQALPNTPAASSTTAASSTGASAPVPSTTSSTTRATVPSAPSAAPTASSNNAQGAIDTSSWKTESIHFTPFSICWTIKYPPALFPSGANNGYSSNESFLNSTANATAGFILKADFVNNYSQAMSSGQKFTTLSGLTGSILTPSGGNWGILVAASENGRSFALALNPLYSNQAAPYNLATGEAMARSITLSCATPASPQ